METTSFGFDINDEKLLGTRVKASWSVSSLIHNLLQSRIRRDSLIILQDHDLHCLQCAWLL